MAHDGKLGILNGLDYNKTDKPKRDRRFIMLPFLPIENQKFREKNKNAFTLCLYLYTKVARKPMNDGLFLYENYYKNNFLACSAPYGLLAGDFGVSKNTVIKWLKELERNELIKIEKINIDKYRKQNIYIVGTHNNYEACFFMEEIYT